MIHPADFAFWILLTILFAFVVVLLAVRGVLRTYASLSLYFAAAIANNITLWLVLQMRGYPSSAYQKTYYLMDLLMTILLYCVVAGIYQKLVPSELLRAQVRIGSIFLVVAIAALPLLGETGQPNFLPFRWLSECSQNLYGACTLLALVLCYPSLWNENVPRHTRQISLVLTGYLVSVWARHAIFLLARTHFSHYPPLFPYFDLLLPLGVAYVFSEASQNLPGDDRSVFP